jgi:murein DD-endopeptidase MepM/ murein hydrolase activator NlpD
MLISILLARRTLIAKSLAFISSLLLSNATSSAKSVENTSEPHDAAPDVSVLAKREGEETHFLVQNKELCEITMTFQMHLVNLNSTTTLPYTATFPPGKTSEAFTLIPTSADARWEYSYTNYYKLGSSCAVHDDSAVYELPFAPGSKYKVTQGYNGSYSHKGSNLYAIDWQMPEGTPVFAARGGIVVKVRDDSDKGGGSIKFDKYNNYVLIRHDDGTLGHYCHLKKGGVCVRPGQMVRSGQLIAHSGNTGFSSGPHLHFSVFKTKDGKERISLPVKFHTADDVLAVTLKEGKRYRAASMPAVEMTARKQPAITAAVQSTIGE